MKTGIKSPSVKKEPKNQELAKAYFILVHTHETSGSFLSSFDSRPNKMGAPTDQDQDLLRAMLIFASAGLDSMVQQLVKDALGIVINCDRGAFQQFESFISTAIKMPVSGSQLPTIDFNMLASALSQRTPRDAFLSTLVKKLTSNSMQSRSQLLSAAAHFGIIADELMSDFKKVDQVFEIRNRISHDMDIDFNQSNRRRFPRKREDMVGNTNLLLEIADKFFVAIEKRVLAKPSPIQK